MKNLKITTVPNEYEILELREVPTESMLNFFSRQPEEAYTYFRPHGFDEKSIKRLKRNKAFLGYVLLDKGNNTMAGYCFNRCFFHGQGFRGRMVDIDYRGKANELLLEILDSTTLLI